MEINVLITKDDEGKYTLKMVVTHVYKELGNKPFMEYYGDTSDTIMELKADYVQQDGNIITTI